MSVTIRWNSTSTSRLPDGGDREFLINESLTLDIMTSENYEVAAQITSLVVEEGVPNTDNVRPLQDRDTIEVMVSDSPVNINLVEGAAMTDVQLPSGATASVINVPDGTTRTADAFETLRGLCKGAVRVDVEGGRRPIEQWFIETISSPRETDTAGVLMCSIVMVEQLTAQLEEVDTPSPRVERRRNRQDRGRTTTTERNENDVSSDPATRNESIASALLGGRLL